VAQEHDPHGRRCHVCGSIVRTVTALTCACGAILAPAQIVHRVQDHGPVEISGYSIIAPGDSDPGSERYFGPSAAAAAQVAGGTITSTGSVALPPMRVAGGGSVSSLG